MYSFRHMFINFIHRDTWLNMHLEHRFVYTLYDIIFRYRDIHWQVLRLFLKR